MPKSTPNSSGAGGSPVSIFDQVSDRVSAAAAALGKAPSRTGTAVPTRALWRVFHEFGTTYRQHRRVAGAQPVPDVRDAAKAFRREPTLATLVAVASVLDEHGYMGRSA
jgi:hypothetical protein